MTNDQNESKEFLAKKELLQLIRKAKSIAVVPSLMSQIDTFSAGAGLFHALQAFTDTLPEEEEKDRKLYFIFTDPVPNLCQSLIKKEDISSDILSRELLITVDYKDTPAQKVEYNTDHDQLKLKIRPIDKSFDLSRIKAKITGFEFDLVFALGFQTFEDMRQMYPALEREFSAAKIVNIDHTSLNERFGFHNFVEPAADTLCLLTLQKITEWGLKPDSKTSIALLTGITHKENTALVA